MKTEVIDDKELDELIERIKKAKSDNLALTESDIVNTKNAYVICILK